MRWKVGSASAIRNGDSLALRVEAEEHGYVFVENGSQKLQIHSPYQARELAKLLWKAARVAEIAQHQTKVAAAASTRALETRDRIVNNELER